MSARNFDCVHLHRYLEISAVNWNLLDHPAAITWDRRSISSHTLCEPATDPPLAFITLNSPNLPWTINVHALHRWYITLDDIFNAVYYFFRTNITTTEFYSFLSYHDQRRAKEAYEWRYRRHRSNRTYQSEKRSGMKRVDFLMGRSRFLGISVTCCRSKKWQLNFT